MKLLFTKSSIVCIIVLIALVWVGSASIIRKPSHLRISSENLPQNRKLLTIPVEKTPHKAERHAKLVNFLKAGQKSIIQKKMASGAVSLVQKSSKKQHNHKHKEVEDGVCEIQLNNYLDTQVSI